MLGLRTASKRYRFRDSWIELLEAIGNYGSCLRALALDDAEDVVDDAEIVAAGRRGAADEVENLAVLEAVFGEPLDFAVPVEIDGDDALVDDSVCMNEIGRSARCEM